jgi:hypothetical protein
MSGIDRLFVIWGEPVAGGRHVIGHLARGSAGFRFWYERDLVPAFDRGFALLPEFPERRGEDEPYCARYLFALFAERIPRTSRVDAGEMLSAWGVEQPDDQFEVLAKSGGIRATDRLELAEYRPVDDDLSAPLEFRVAGRRHLTDPASLSVSAPVMLRREPDNLADTCAVIVDRQGRRAGYVPRQYTAPISRLLDRGVLLAGEVVRELVVPDDLGRWVVRVSRR